MRKKSLTCSPNCFESFLKRNYFPNELREGNSGENNNFGQRANQLFSSKKKRSCKHKDESYAKELPSKVTIKKINFKNKNLSSATTINVSAHEATIFSCVKHPLE